MLKRSTALLVGVALSAAGCSAGRDDTPDTETRPTGPATTGERLRAGLYHIVEVGDMATEERRCFSEAHIAAGRFSPPDSLGEGWTVEKNRMSGGTIEVVARHRSGGSLGIGGTFGPDSFATEGTLEVKLNGDTHVVRTRQRGRFVSSTCPPDMNDGEAAL
ncbi:MAG: hypothetical protein U0S50_10915 [Sphingopyxis sp.]|uniref:hypothetical protein n=1 Tax=Sphingopyxis sp. TaxID=1908224 RepID=UPI002ABB5C3F|nr:hypothetical protein [Sphingopyxis sp.]MDZ3832317.1 hypothetical protein [Sphingopyxis sp.]